jgi:hypothetical protein
MYAQELAKVSGKEQAPAAGGNGSDPSPAVEDVAGDDAADQQASLVGPSAIRPAEAEATRDGIASKEQAHVDLGMFFSPL